MGPENQARKMQSEIDRIDDVTRSIGQLLRENREEKGLTIPQVAIETRIRQLYIKAIEEGDVESLPGEIYKIGFIKTYATFLNLDAMEILRRIGVQQDASINFTHNKYAILPEYQRQPNKKILYLSLLAAFCFSIFAYITHNSQKTEENSLLTKVFQEENDLNEDVNTAINEPVSSLKFDKLETQSSTMKANTAILPQLTTTTSNNSPSQEKNSPSSIPATSNEITITAFQDSWVQILDASEKTVYVRLMHAGDTYIVPSQGKYTLNTGNAGGLKITSRGQETKILGVNGQVIRGINLNESGLSPYFENVVSSDFKRQTSLEKTFVNKSNKLSRNNYVSTR